MDRACLSAAALAATICLLIAAPSVRAQEEVAPVDGAAPVDQAAPSDAGSAPASEDTTSAPGGSGAAPTDADSGSTTPSGAGAAAGSAPAQPGASGAQDPSGAAPATQTPASAPTQAAPPPAPAPAPRDPAPPPPSSIAFTQATGEPKAPAAPKLETISPAPPAGPVEHSPAATDGGASTWRAEPGRSLERLVRRVDRELGTLQPQIDALQRRLDEGAPPPPAQVIRLRSTLQRIAPALLALDTRLASSGPLSPRVKALLRRVRVRAAGARASAAGLIVALRRSGARGAEVRSLLRELESLTAPRAVLALEAPAAPAAPAPRSGATAVFAHDEVAPAAATPEMSELSAQPPAADRPAAGPPDADRSGDSPPSNSAPGSASASPGGVFSGAGMASLAILLFGFALPRLLRRVDMAPGRGYAAAFLTPLERPG